MKKHLKYIVIGLILFVISGIGWVFLCDQLGLFGQKEEKKETYLYKTKEFVVNIQGNKYLRTTLTFETEDEKVKESIGEKSAKIEDKVITYLSDLTVNDLKSGDGKACMKLALVQSGNEVMGDGYFTEVYFNDFLWQ